MRRSDARIALFSLLIFSIVLYIKAGITAAYLAADDFQWIAGGHAFSVARLLQVSSRNHFYRPVIETWFALVVAVCGNQASCYHAASLGVHLLNIALMFALGNTLARDLRIAWLGALLFAIQPAATQAVVWISAITGVLATAFCLTALLTMVASWQATTYRVRYEAAAVILFCLALFSHEAASTLPILAWIIWRQWGPDDVARRPVVLYGAAATLGLFGLAAIVANSGNYVFTESHYAVGPHGVRHLFEYLVALYVGPGWWLPYLVCGLALAGLLIATPMTRLGALWLLVTLLPYVWFTWSNVSRYLYVPSIGFGWAVAGAVVAACDAASARFAPRRMVGPIAYVVAVVFIAVRFSRFEVASIRSRIDWLEDWRRYAIGLAGVQPLGGRVDVPAPRDDLVDRMYIEPMVRWIHQDYTLTVVVHPPPP